MTVSSSRPPGRYWEAFSPFRSLSHGWLDGTHGRAPSASGLSWLTRQFETYYPDELPMPWIYPTAEGGVQLEWRSGDREITLDIDLDRQIGEWHGLDLSTGDESADNLDLSNSEGWSELGRRLCELGGIDR
ncbi:hypothetical protein [Thioalkalivibrio nitratireducens]|nr:hypothetical protein [Thioalkalivibrio nitratireducens]